jgi:hypothetical protein
MALAAGVFAIFTGLNVVEKPAQTAPITQT